MRLVGEQDSLKPWAVQYQLPDGLIIGYDYCWTRRGAQRLARIMNRKRGLAPKSTWVATVKRNR